MKVASPNVFGGTAKAESPGVPLLTSKVAVIVPDKKFAVLACVAVMVAEPTPTIVIMSFAIVATSVLELAYVKAPFPVLVGGVILKAAFPNAFAGIEKLVITGVRLVTTSCAVVVPNVLFGVLACTTVMVEVPTPTMVIVVPATVATNEFELVYVKPPVLLVVGAVMLKGASPTIFAGTAKSVSTVVIKLTCNNADTVADV